MSSIYYIMKNKNGIPIEKTGQTKQLPLKRTLFFCFIDFLREIVTAVFRRKHTNENFNKRKRKILYYDKDFRFLCFLMKMPLREWFPAKNLHFAQSKWEIP